MGRAVALSVTCVCLLFACSDTEAPPDKDRPSAVKGYTADESTRDAAQDSLTKAEKLLGAAGSARFETAFALGPLEMSIAGVFSLADGHSDYTMVLPEEQADMSVRTLLTEAGAYSLVTVDGQPQDCWYGYSTAATGQAISPIPSAAYMLIEPEAVGFLDGGTESEIVMNVLLDEATSAVFPKLANTNAGDIPADASILAVARLKGDEFASLTYRIRDVFDALETAGIDIAELSDGAVTTDVLDAIGDSEAVTEFSEHGLNVEVKTPPDELVANFEPGMSEEDFKPCAAAQ